MQDFVQPTIKLGLIVPGDNYRETYDPTKLAELRAQIIAAGGVSSPIKVRPHPTKEGKWEIVFGKRRWLCAGDLFGEDYDMPVTVSDLTDAQARAARIIENNGRDDPSAIEEAKGAAELLQINNGDKEQTRLQLGWKRELLDARLMLLNCAPEVQQAVIERNPNVKPGHAELLAGLPHDRQVKVLAGILQHKVPVEVLKKQLGQFSKRLSEAIFDTAQCVGCPHNSAQQSALFDESIGEGFCQHPSHYEELTLKVLEARAEPLREQYQVVRLVKASDGFLPLPVGPDGPLGVGAEQYTACKGCASFGCSLSAVAGSYGAVEGSLCFDAQCHSTKVAERRRSEREAAKAAAEPVASTTTGSKSKPVAKANAKRVSNQTPPRVAQYRQERWRAWVATRLMMEPIRNHRVLAALIASSCLQSFNSGKFVEAAVKLVKPAKFGSNMFKAALEQADAFDPMTLPQIVQAVTASAAFGVDLSNLEVLLNYLEVDEGKHFKLNAEYLELLTTNELESLADELKLRKTMGDAAFKKARAGNKPKFIDALLNVKGFEYAGAVPKAMRYARKKYRFSNGSGGSDDAAHGSDGGPTEEAGEPTGALAAG